MRVYFCIIEFFGPTSHPNCTVLFDGLIAKFETEPGYPSDLVVLTAYLTQFTVVVTYARSASAPHQVAGANA